MRTFAQQPKTTQQTASAKSTIPGRAHFGQSRVVSSILQLQPTIGNHAVQRMLQADAQEPEAGMTGTATSRFGHDFSRIPIHASAANAIQTKLAINRPGDSYEQEADRVSEQITRTPQPRLQRKCACGGTPGPTGECEEYRKKRLSLQRESLDVAGPVSDDFAPPIVHDVLRSPARSLDPQTRAFMEPHFGHDFSRVRIHADAGASHAADAVQAQAFTVGSDIVMGSGKFMPSTPAGRKLLAHELTHVVQQTASRGAALRLQRAPDKEPRKAPAQEPKKEPSKEPKRVDVVLLGEGVTSGEELARVLAPGGKIIRVKSMGEAAAALSKIDVPIRTLYFITHSLADGALQFGKSEGFVKPDDIASKLKGSVPADKAPQNVDFRGCSVGTSPKAMNQIRGALGAKSVLAGNCYAVIQNTTPVKISGKEITQASDVTEENRPEFEKLRKRTVNKLGPAKKCILNNSDKGYFAMGGKYVALWFNTSLSTEWKKDESICYNEINPQTVDPNQAPAASKGCRLVRVEEQPEPVETKPQD